MKLTQIDLAEGRGGSQREMPASEAVARAEEACGGTLLLFEPDGVPRAAVAICPGGGFGKVNTEHEGVAFAEWFVAHGIAAGVVCPKAIRRFRSRMSNGPRSCCTIVSTA